MNEMDEVVAKAICAALRQEWREGTYPLCTGPNFEWEDHDADKLNSQWRHAASCVREALKSAGFAIVPDEAQALERGKGIKLT